VKQAALKKRSSSSRNPLASETPFLSGIGPIDATLDRLLQSEEFTDIDRPFARFMERLSGAPNSEVTMAAALASRSQRRGSICLDLRTVAGTVFPEASTPANVRQRLPSLETWLDALRKASVVGRPGEFRPLVLDQCGRLYLHRYRQYEFNLAKGILRRAEQETEGINGPLLQEGLDRLFPAALLSGEMDWQRVAAATAVKRNLCVISGGPGTGKTHTVIGLLVLLLEQSGNRPLRIALAAPTGKAAARLQESLKKWKPTLPCNDAIKARLPEESFTLHRLLGGLPDSAQFKHNAENPLPFDVVVVDEASMVDLALMAKLFAATPPSARLVLLGDKDQLASVEAGAVLGDICAGVRPSPGAATLDSSFAPSNSSVDRHPHLAAPGDGRTPAPLSACIVELRKNYRFGSDNGILALSQAINDGDAERTLGLLNLRPALETTQPGEAGGVTAAALPSPAQLKERLRAKTLEGLGKLVRAREPFAALQALNQFRILCAVRRGPFGVETVNRLVEEILSEAGLLSTRERWYAGRPLLVTRNDYNLKLFNGDVGIILPDEATGEPCAWFLGPDDSLRGLPPIRLPEHETVFAMTVHKSQGGEFEEVLFILPDRASPLLTRELVYTGVTRASHRVELWFNETVLRVAVACRVERASGLREAIRGAEEGQQVGR